MSAWLRFQARGVWFVARAAFFAFVAWLPILGTAVALVIGVATGNYWPLVVALIAMIPLGALSDRLALAAEKLRDELDAP